MSQSLPLDHFKWVPERDFHHFTSKFIMDLTKTARNEGYIFDVDLEYPDRLHEKHNSLPLCAENLTITWDMLSPWSKKVWKDLNGSTTYKSRKLTATCFDKEHYVCHWRNLAFYLKMGLRLKKIHRILAFHQKPFIRSHVEMCVEGRRNAKSKVEEKMYKGLSNFLYGKMIENPENRVDCKFVRTKEQANKRLRDPSMKSAVICSENLTMTFHRKKKLVLNQNWAVGFSILELSKLFMLESYYDRMQSTYPGDMCILASDTDSFILLARHGERSFDDFLQKFKDDWDFSQIPETHPLHDNSRKHKIGHFKLESNPNARIVAFAGLKSKSYCVKDMNDVLERRAKGIRTAFQNKLTFDDYKDVIVNGGKKSVSQISLQTKDHVTKTVKTTKTCFTAFDDKRKFRTKVFFNFTDSLGFALCPIHTTPYGSALAKRTLAAHEEAKARGCTDEHLYPCEFCASDFRGENLY